MPKTLVINKSIVYVQLHRNRQLYTNRFALRQSHASRVASKEACSTDTFGLCVLRTLHTGRRLSVRELEIKASSFSLPQSKKLLYHSTLRIVLQSHCDRDPGREPQFSQRSKVNS